MSDKLTPLSPELQAEFEIRRESAVVVQHKCKGCGQWYETPKRGMAWVEQFFCDCGAYVECDIPPLEILLKPTNEQILSALDPDAKLDTGMSTKEAIRRAEIWWNGRGRFIMKDKPNPFSTLDPSDPNYMPSGIVAGLDWDALTKTEKLNIVKAWHHFAVRKPDLIGGAGDTHSMQNRKDVQ